MLDVENLRYYTQAIAHLAMVLSGMRCTSNNVSTVYRNERPITSVQYCKMRRRDLQMCL